MKNKKTKHMAECGHNLGDIQYNIIEDVESKRVEEKDVFDKPSSSKVTKVTKKSSKLPAKKNKTIKKKYT